MHRLFPGLLLAGALSCNNYVLFNLAGYEQASFSNEADILFIIDNSASMVEETTALALEFDVFIDALTSVESGSAQVTETLTDAVGNYLAYTQERGRYLDYNLAITTTSVDFTRGPTKGIDAGEAGLLLGDPTVVSKGDEGLDELFASNLLCDAANWEGVDVPTDPDYECDTDNGGVITQQYLDCVCGFGEWEDGGGAGDEEPLEAAFLALCRAVDDPPAECYDPLSPFSEGDELSNPGFLREESTVVVVIVSDEGDNSRRLAQGDEDPTVYLDLFEDFDRPIRFVTIGPNWDGETLSCTSTSVPTWTVERLQTMTEATGGFYNVISEAGAGGECETTDFAQHLQDLGALLGDLQTAFQLQSIPDVTTIRVWVDGEEISSGELIDGEYGQSDAVYSDGWSYDPGQNAVVFWGSAIPDYNQDVEIYYRPLDGRPRDLPF